MKMITNIWCPQGISIFVMNMILKFDMKMIPNIWYPQVISKFDIKMISIFDMKLILIIDINREYQIFYIYINQNDISNIWYDYDTN